MGRYSAYFDKLTLMEDKLALRKEFIRLCLKDQSADLEPEECTISSCMAGRGAFWISWDGKMYPCGMLPAFARDIRQESFADAWRNTHLAAQDMRVPAQCTVCAYQKICPTCAAVSMSVTGATDGLPEELCRRTKAYTECILEE